MNTYEARIWEKAEHWYFYAKIEAKDERDAYIRLRKEWPAKEYSISQVRSIGRAA